MWIFIGVAIIVLILWRMLQVQKIGVVANLARDEIRAEQERMPRLREQLVREGKSWAIAHLDDIARGGREDELLFWLDAHDRRVVDETIVLPPPFGKRARIFQQSFESLCAEHPEKADFFRDVRFLGYLGPKTTTADPPPEAFPEPSEHKKLKFEFIRRRVVETLRNDPRTNNLENPADIRRAIESVVGEWEPPEKLLLRSTTETERRALLGPAIATHASYGRLVELAKLLFVNLPKAETQLEWAKCALEAAKYSLPERDFNISLPDRGLRRQLDFLQSGVLQRFQPSLWRCNPHDDPDEEDGEQSLKGLAEIYSFNFSDTDPNDVALKQLCRQIVSGAESEKVLSFAFPVALSDEISGEAQPTGRSTDSRHERTDQPWRFPSAPSAAGRRNGNTSTPCFDAKPAESMSASMCSSTWWLS